MAKTLLEGHGPTILTTSLMANLTRFWVAYIAGSQNYSFFKFLFFSSVAALSWSSLNVAAGYLAGSQREKLESWLAGLGILSWALLLLAGLIIYRKIKSYLANTNQGQ
jgi:membrane protein DedA with SNARE-associated domain